MSDENSAKRKRQKMTKSDMQDKIKHLTNLHEEIVYRINTGQNLSDEEINKLDIRRGEIAEDLANAKAEAEDSTYGNTLLEV